MTEHFSSVVVDIAKVRDYCLSRSHPRGRHKARVFRARLGLTGRHAATLRRTLLQAARDRQNDLRVATNDQYGRRYVLDVSVTGPTGTALVRSAWIVRAGEDVLRFVSCYVL